MPVKFICSHCHRLLSVGARKIGHRLSCPSCQMHVTVPSVEEGAAMIQWREEVRSENQQQEDPYAEFVVHDDQNNLLLEAERKRSFPSSSSEDNGRLSIPRSIVYIQGALLGLVGITAFTFGIIVGNAGPGDGVDDLDGVPATLSGKLTYTSGGNPDTPDIGSVIVALPVGSRPDEKIDPDGLRPDQPPPADDQTAVVAIRTLWGAYARTGASGDFQLEVPRSGRYFVLLISNNLKRGQGQLSSREDVAQMGRFFLHPADLLGSNRYRWLEQSLRGNQVLDVRFSP